MAAACRTVSDDLPGFTVRAADVVMREIPEYSAVISYSDLAMAIHGLTQATLFALAENRLPTAEDAEAGFELGRHRARQGMAADAVMQAFHSTIGELWRELTETVAAEDRHLLLGAVPTLWRWLHALTDGVARGYHHEELARLTRVAGVSR